MMEEEFTGRSSLDNQIREAKTRAELFSKSLQDARAQEAIALKILEQERERWAHSFEEKSIMIEQLERELTSTVEALDVERSTDKLPKAADLKEFSNSEVDQSFHDLMTDVNAHIPTLNSSIEYPAMRRTMDGNFQTRYSDAPLRSAFGAGSTHPHQSYVAASAERSGPRAAAEHQPKRAVSPVREKARTDDTAVWRDLLEQYQDQLKLSKSECIAAAEDKERLRGQVTRLEKQVTKLAEEKQLFATACEHAEGKLKFRVAQVIECEESKEILTKRVSELSSLNAELQSQLTSLRHELVLANTELRIHSTRTQNQALRENVQDITELVPHPAHSQQEHPQPARASPQTQVRGVNWEPVHTRSLEPVHSATPFLTSMSREDDGDFPYPARQRIQATEAYAKDLHRQLDEAHANYTAQLEDAKRTTSSLQMLLKDSERRGDDLRARCQAAEQGAAQYQAERNALLTMVSKLHLSETTKATNAQAFAAHQEASQAMSQEPQQSVVHRGDGHLSAASPALDNKVPDTIAQANSPPQVNPVPQASPSIDRYSEVQRATLDQRLSRSRDSVENHDALMSRPTHDVRDPLVPSVELDDSYSASETESELSRSFNEHHVNPHTSATATQSVLFTHEGTHRIASTSATEPPAAANAAHAPILRMLSSSGDAEGPSTRKRTTKRRTRSASGEGKAVTKTATSTPPAVQAKEPTRSPAAAVGQPGKSMVIRKPASYTGAAGASTDKSLKSAVTPAPTTAATKVKAASGKKAPSPATTKVSKAKTSTTKPTAKSSSRPIQVHVPASYSNENDFSWGSDDMPQPVVRQGEDAYPTDRELEDGMDGDSVPTISHLPLVQAPYHATVSGIAVQVPLQFSPSAAAHHEQCDPESDEESLKEANDMLSRTMELVEIPDSHVEGGISYYEINRARSNSLHSVNSVVSSHTGRSVSVVESPPEVPPPAYSGVTEVKIRRKSAPGELVNRAGRSPQVATQSSAGHRGSAAKKLKPTTVRTPSPMLRTASAHSAPSSRTVKVVPSSATASAARMPYTPASYSASVAAGVPAASLPAVVTPAGSTSKVAKLLSAYGQNSLTKKVPGGSKVKATAVKSNSMAY